MARRCCACGRSVSASVYALPFQIHADGRRRLADHARLIGGPEAERRAAAHDAAAAIYERAAQVEEELLDAPAPCAACKGSRLCRECQGQYIGRDAHGVAWGQCPACHEGTCPTCKGGR